MEYLRKLSDQEINEYKLFLKNNDFLLIKNILLPSAIMNFNNNIEFGKPLDELQFGRQHNLKNNSQKICNDYHIESFKLYKQIIGEEYYPTYTFAMKYNKNNECIPHLDLVQNELSATTCYSAEKNYPIYISKQFMDNNYKERYSEDPTNIKDDDIIEINIEVGDIGFFNGRNHLHFRKKLNENINYRAILTHYSKTIENSEEWIKKTKDSVQYLNSNGGPIYHRSFT